MSSLRISALLLLQHRSEKPCMGVMKLWALARAQTFVILLAACYSSSVLLLLLALPSRAPRAFPHHLQGYPLVVEAIALPQHRPRVFLLFRNFDGSIPSLCTQPKQCFRPIYQSTRSRPTRYFIIAPSSSSLTFGPSSTLGNKH